MGKIGEGKMKNKTKIYVMLIAFSMISVFGASAVIADTSDVTTTWIVPADTTISISFPNGQAKIEFDAASQNFSNQCATDQADATAALRVSNHGNTAITVEASWLAEWPTGVTSVNISIGDDTNASKLWYGDANETTNQTWNASLAVDGANDFWFWTDGAEVEETAGIERTLRVYSSNA